MWFILFIFIYHESSYVGSSGVSALKIKIKYCVTELSMCSLADFSRILLLFSFQYLTNQTDSMKNT